jgi:hypothetical protein
MHAPEISATLTSIFARRSDSPHTFAAAGGSARHSIDGPSLIG